jgi:hypothetical protein
MEEKEDFSQVIESLPSGSFTRNVATAQVHRNTTG